MDKHSDIWHDLEAKESFLEPKQRCIHELSNLMQEGREGEVGNV